MIRQGGRMGRSMDPATSSTTVWGTATSATGSTTFSMVTTPVKLKKKIRVINSDQDPADSFRSLLIRIRNTTKNIRKSKFRV